jgi:hypothetical protein
VGQEEKTCEIRANSGLCFPDWWVEHLISVFGISVIVDEIVDEKMMKMARAVPVKLKHMGYNERWHSPRSHRRQDDSQPADFL